MVKQILRLISKEISGLHEAAYLLAIFAFLSQVLALFRDRLLASSFGAGATLDIYYASFRIPDLIFVTVGSLVSISILVPFFTERIGKDAEAKNLIDSVFTVFFGIIISVALLAFIFIPFITPKLFPGIVGDEAVRLITLSRILLLSPLLLGFSNFFASIVQMHNRFLLYAISPILYNAGIIFGILVFYPIWGIYGLGLGVILGAILHCGVQIPFIIEKKSFPKIIKSIDLVSVKRIIGLSVPRTVTLATSSVSAFALVGMASLVGQGSIAIFNFSFNLQSVPLSIIGVSYSSAVFPMLSRLFVQGERNAFLDKMITTTKHIIFWSTPVAALFIVLRAQIVRTILGAGNFDWSDTKLTAAALALFTLSIIPQSLILLFVRAFYSEGKTSKPLLINVFSMIVTIIFGYVLLSAYNSYPTFAYFFQSLLHIESVGGSAVIMLALAYSLGITFNTILHWIAFHKEFPSFTRPVLTTAFKSISASIIMGYVSYKALDLFDNIFNLNTLPGIFLQGLCAGLVGIAVGVIVLKLLKSDELEQVLKTFHQKVWKIDKTLVVDELV